MTLAAVALVAILTVVAKPRSESRTIEVTARDMTFYVAGVTEGNPEIRLARGETVRIVFRNEDTGLTHDLVVPGLGATIEAISGQGSASVVLRAPERPGRYDYLCTPHARMMRGTIVVE